MGDLTEPQRKMLLGSEPSDRDPDEGAGVELWTGAIRCALGVTTDGEVKPWLQTAIDFLTGSYEPLEEAEAATRPPPVKEAEPPAPSRVVTAEPYLAAIAGRPDDLDVLGALPDIIAHWVANNLGVALTLTEARQAARAALTTPPALQARVEALDEPTRWLLKIVAAAGGKIDAGDCPWSPLNAFCDDRGTGTDTFNLANEAGYLRTGHDSDSDGSTAYLTDKGRSALTGCRDDG